MRQRRRHYGSRGVLGTVAEWYGWHRRTAWLVAGMVVVIGFQLCYPADRALPFARLGADRVGWSTDQMIVQKLVADYGKTSLTTTIRGHVTVTPFAESGLTTDNDRILAGLHNYPWYWRIVPFSIFVKGALVHQPVVTTVDDDRFSLYAKDRAAECAVAPKNAGVVVREGEVQLDPAQNGQTCSTDSLRRQLTAPALNKTGITIAVRTTAQKPERSNQDVQPLLTEAKAVAEHQLTLYVAGKTYTVDKPTRASWLAFPEDPATKTIRVGLNDNAVKAYLATIQKDIYIAPGTTVVSTRDGTETGRTVGNDGQGIDLTPTIAAIRKQLLKDDGVVVATLAVLPATVRYDRTYSKTPAGLQALLNDLVKDKGDYAIAVRKLGDNSGASASGDKQYHPASTYKLFVAYSTLKRIDSNQLNWNQPTTGGQTISQCFDNMIINSDNACAEWFGQTIGWNTLTNEARALGANNTTLSRPFVSTANDVALLLQKLELKQLGLSDTSRTRWLDAMKRQVYRKGIPAGVAGVIVADKVGFLDALLHDAAIVYAPGGTYILTIYSNDSSWAQIADAARQIHAQLQ